MDTISFLLGSGFSVADGVPLVSEIKLISMNWKDYIVSNEEALLGKLAIKGTRISIEHIINLFA